MDWKLFVIAGLVVVIAGLGIAWASGTFPGASTDNALVRFDGTGGSTVQNGQTVEDDSGNVVVTGSVTAGGADGARRLELTNNSTREPTASKMEIYPEGNTWKFNENGSEKDPVYVGDAFNTTDELTGKLDVDDHTATGTIATQACYGGVVTNTGAGGAIVLTLPDAVKGMSVLIVLTAAQDVDINPNGSERILVDTDANGDALSSDATIGSYYSLVAVSATQWLPIGKNGTWTDVN